MYDGFARKSEKCRRQFLVNGWLFAGKGIEEVSGRIMRDKFDREF